MAQQFRIDQIQYWVWALSQEWPSMPNGYDGRNGHDRLKRMAPGYKNVTQASLTTLDKKLEQELEMDARHQQHYWLWVDRAIEAIGMLEADGLDLASRGKVFAQNYYKAHREASKQNAFISLVKPNLEMYKAQLSQSNVVFEATPNNPRQDAQEIADFNDYAAEILDGNNWDDQQGSMIHDFGAYGSGVLMVKYDDLEASPDDMFLEDRIDAGEVIEFEEYMRSRRLIKAHVVRHVDTFEIIAHRNAAGRGSWNIAESMEHPYVHWVRQRRVSWLKRKYPEHAKKISDNTSDVYRQTNPRSFVLDYNDDDQCTIKSTYIRFPVSYDITIPVRLADGEIVERVNTKNRSAILRVDRVEGVGIVDMELDAFAHNMLPVVQAVNFPSVKHSRGIGLCKYGYAPQKVHQIMFNGKLRMFERMVKGGGWFFKDVIDKSEIVKQQKEGTWIGIDRDSLPADLKTRPVSDLVTNNQPMQFPAIYDNLMAQTDNYVNTAMSAPPARKGFASGSGTSGRKELALINQSDDISSGGRRSYEVSMLPLGKMVHSNIVQFDGDRMDIEFSVEDPDMPQGTRRVALNEVINQQIEYDPFAPQDGRFSRWKVLPTKIKNHLKSLRFTTKLSTRSLLPTNPTERRLFMSDFITRIQPLTETKRGIELLKWQVEQGLGGLPGWERRIAAIEESIEEDRQFQAQLAQREQQREDMAMQMDHTEKMEELAQNLKRLQDSAAADQAEAFIDFLDVLIDAAESDKNLNVRNLLAEAQNLNQLTR